MQLITSKRLKNYPRLFFLSEWIIITVNLLFHNGWKGLGGQILGMDFVSQFAAGILFRNDVNILYTDEAQSSLQQALLSPTSLTIFIPFISPSYVAMAYGPYTIPPIFIAPGVRWLLTSVFALFSAKWLILTILQLKLVYAAIQLIVPTLIFCTSYIFMVLAHKIKVLTPEMDNGFLY